MNQRTPLTRSRTAVAFTLLGAVAFATVLGACNQLTEYNPTTNRYGTVNISGKRDTGSTVRATAVATFFEALSAAVPNAAGQQNDLCAFTTYDSIPTVLRGLNPAGDAVKLTVGGVVTSLPYETANSRYATLSTAPLTYKAGDVVSASIPGSGTIFPAANISVKLAEPVIPGPVTVPAGGFPFVVTWNATNDTTSVMLIALRYINGSGSSAINEQIYCSAKDDGRFEIPANGLTSFFASTVTSRSLVLTRFRTNESLLDDKTLLFIGSTVDTTILVR